MVVEDEDLEWTLTSRALATVWLEPHQVFRAKGVTDALKILQMSRVDVVLLDLNVVDSQGLNTVEAVAKATEGSVILVTTSMKDKGTALAALQKGAQDYIVKGEFSPADLGRAIEFALARHGRTQLSRPEHPQVKIDFNRLKLISVATGAPREIDLTATEVKLVSLFLSRLGQAVSREDLAAQVLGAGTATSDRTTDNQVSRLRAKIEGSGLALVSVRGVGYRLEIEE